MPTPSRVRVTSYTSPGRLVPKGARGLRAGVVSLRRAEIMAWHSTHAREELLIVLRGTVDLEFRAPPRVAARRIALGAGQCALLCAELLHRVVNRSRATARYLYVTAPAPSSG